MRIATLVLGLLMALLVPLSAANAQRGANPDSWELLGEQTVGFRDDRDVLTINQDEAWFRNRAYRTLHFVIDRGDIEMKDVTLVYINGQREQFNIGKKIKKGGQFALDLRGERSFLRQIEMHYRGEFGISLGGGGLRVDQAVVKVFGERVQRRPEPVAERPVFERSGWSVIDTRTFETGDDQVTFSSRRGDGRFGQIRLKAGREAVRIRDVEVRFRNGETQTVPIRSRLEEGEESRAIDLAGDTRFLDTVTVNLEPRRRPGRIELTLLGERRVGREGTPVVGGGGGDIYASRGWTFLGEQTVGFTAERDVIDVAQSEDWHRNRQFRSLHLIALRNDIFMKALRVTYINGHSEEFVIERSIPAGTDTEVDLRGERSFIRRIEMVYRSKPNFRGQAVMKVYGEPGRR